MLTYLTLCITGYLVLEILRAPRSADATGYLLVSGLVPLPVYMVGNSAAAGVFAIDVCLLAYLVVHRRSACYAVKHKALVAGVGALFGFSMLATFSGAFNFLFVDPDPLKFYAFTVVKFWEYALLAAVLIASRPDAAQLRKICAILVTGILIYEVLHVLHISGIVPMSGEAYFGPQAAYFDAGEMRYSPFSDRTAWFLTSSRAAVGGTASISAWVSLMVSEAYRGKIKAIAAVTAVLSIFSVFAVSSRSDIAGLAVATLVFVLCAPPRQWKVYAAVAIAVASLYAGYVTLVLSPANQATATERMRELWNPELREQGDYADRSSDRAAMLRYLPEHPEDLLIGVGPGNFHWYQTNGITYNFFGHNSYLHWTGELGIGGLFLLLAWCFSVCRYAMNRIWMRRRPHIFQLAARTCLALVVGRMVAAWGGESLFGTENMAYYSMYFLGFVYLLASIAWVPWCGSSSGFRGVLPASRAVSPSA